MWHVCTAPIAHLFWRSFVEPELRWCVAHAGDVTPHKAVVLPTQCWSREGLGVELGGRCESKQL